MSTLAQQLEDTDATIRRVLKPEIRERLARHSTVLRENGTLGRALPAGAPAPAFALPDLAGQIVSSAALIARGPLVISFFRGTWCPYCATELRALGDCYDRIRATGAELVTVAPQSVEDGEHYFALNPVRFPILIDKGAAVTRAYGLSYEVPEELTKIYRGVFGVDVARVNRDRAWRLPMPARYVIGSDGVIADARVETDFRLRTEPDKTIAFLEGMQAPATG